MRKLVSIISAVYNEEKTIPIFYPRLMAVLAPWREKYDFEIIFTNNASKDRTASLVRKLREQDTSVQLLTLSRNFGYQCSVQAGFSYAVGDATIVIDVDCEDPPEMIPRFLQHWEEGYDVVYGERTDRPEPLIIRKLRSLFYHLLSISADMDVLLYMAEFALISANVRRSILQNRTSFPFLRTEIGYVGFSRLGLPYRRESRVAGETHYNLFGMFVFAVAGILTTSTILLRLSAYAFPAAALLNIALMAVDWRQGTDVGFRICVIGDLLYVVLLLTILAIYIARIYKNGMSRPNFVINPRESNLNRALPSTSTSPGYWPPLEA